MSTDLPAMVRIVVLGSSVEHVQLEPGDALGTVLARTGIDPRGRDVRINGRAATNDDPLAGGDLVTLIPPIRGGGERRARGSD